MGVIPSRYSPVRTGAGRQGHRRAGRRPPGRDRPGLPGPPRPPGRAGRGLAARPAHPDARVHRRGARRVGRGQRLPGGAARALRLPGLPGRQGQPRACPIDRVPAAARGDGPAGAGGRVPLPARGRIGPACGTSTVRSPTGCSGRPSTSATRRCPLYTPEPDVIHEVIGHANQLAGPGYADMYRLVGAAVARTRDEEALRFLSHVFWYTMEFGVVRERRRASSVRSGHPVVGRRDVQLPPTPTCVPSTCWPWAGRSTTSPASSPCCTCGPRPAELEDRLSRFLESFDDATPGRLARKAG